MKKYNPNFNDPRIKKKVLEAVTWSSICLDAHKPKRWARIHIDRRIGKSDKNLGRFLRHHLLVTADSTYNPFTKKCKSYTLNTKGMALLCEKIGKPIKHKRTTSRIALDYLKTKYHDQLTTGQFEYTDKSNRWWNDCQQIRSKTRRALFIEYNYNYNYDIKSAAPTLIYEYARKLGISKRIKLNTLKQYLEDPKLSRQQLAQRIGVEYNTAKTVIICAFSGGRMGPTNSIAREIKNRISYHKLTKDLWFRELQKEIAKLWRIIKIHRGINKMTSHTKWRIYFELERRVMWTVVDLFKKNQARMFLEHDGWRSDLFLTAQELSAHVKLKTGFRVQFDVEVYR